MPHGTRLGDHKEFPNRTDKNENLQRSALWKSFKINNNNIIINEYYNNNNKNKVKNIKVNE